MLPEQMNRTGADLGDGALEEMAKHDIRCAQINVFFYGGYRYENLADAIAEAKRHPQPG